MKLAFRTTGRFEKEFRLAVKQGKDISKLQSLMRALVHKVPLDRRHRHHAVIDESAGRHKIHVEQDWLLIYKREHGLIIFEQTGTHADLFE